MVPPTYTQKDDVESNGGSLENVAKVFVLILCGVLKVVACSVQLRKAAPHVVPQLSSDSSFYQAACPNI